MLPETILGNFWLAECLQYLRVQNYRHPVYRSKVVLAIVEVIFLLTSARKCLFVSSKRKGPGEEGAAGYCPKSFSQKGRTWCSALSIGITGKSALEIGHFPRQNFWMISGGPFLSRPFGLLLNFGNSAGANCILLFL